MTLNNKFFWIILQIKSLTLPTRGNTHAEKIVQIARLQYAVGWPESVDCHEYRKMWWLNLHVQKSTIFPSGPRILSQPEILPWRMLHLSMAKSCWHNLDFVDPRGESFYLGIHSQTLLLPSCTMKELELIKKKQFPYRFLKHYLKDFFHIISLSTWMSRQRLERCSSDTIRDIDLAIPSTSGY